MAPVVCIGMPYLLGFMKGQGVTNWKDHTTRFKACCTYDNFKWGGTVFAPQTRIPDNIEHGETYSKSVTMRVFCTILNISINLTSQSQYCDAQC